MGDKFVTITTEQTVTGTKTFESPTTFNSLITANGSINVADDGMILLNNGNVGAIGKNAINGMFIQAQSDILISAPQDESKLVVSPSKNATTNCIATVGWVRENAIAPAETDTGYAFSNAGTIEYKNSTVNQTKTVVTGQTWNGTQLVLTREQWEITNGLITKITQMSNITINTTVYTP